MIFNHVTLLVLLDLSAAFDTVSHDVLLDRLHNDVGLRGNALKEVSESLYMVRYQIISSGLWCSTRILPWTFIIHS